ncbi:hypothetical protein B0H14DRAFT_3735670 [Mycena olivaceomarginata]|nr:hypothetical protein B0H14DRAFT_3735670 [Mycena olivaceomarginata]
MPEPKTSIKPGKSRQAIERDRQNDLARRREAEMQFSALRDVQIPEEVRTSRVQTTMETELWNQLEEDPHAAGFDLGIDNTTQQYNELCSEMNSLWNAGTIGHNASFSLGEGNEEAEDLIEDDNDDEFLAEIMQNAAINDPKEGDILDFDHQESANQAWNGLRLDNPQTRKFIHVYPEIPEDGVIREIWHAQKWRRDMDLNNLSPMYDAKHLNAHFYVNEVARLDSGQLVIPVRWLQCGKKICADAVVATVLDSETILINASELTANYLDLQDENCLPSWSEQTVKSGFPETHAEPQKGVGRCDPLYSSFIDYFGDDVSGNRSKSWNKHWNAYMTHRNLPRALLHQEYHSFETTHKEPVKGHPTIQCKARYVSHIGSKGNYSCRKCEAGGTEKEKETNECFHSLFAPGVARSKEKIVTELNKQVKLACAGVAKHVEDAQRTTGVKDAYTQHWIEYLLEQYKQKKAEGQRPKDIESQLVQWTLNNEDKIYSFDPTKDTPVEILHTILLGVVKYIWHLSHTSWSAAQKQLYSLRLQSTNTDGLSIHAIRANYIMQYANSLIGRQFKTIAQVNVFHVHGIVTDDQFATWRAVGELSALIWVPEIANVEEYLSDLRVAAGNVLDAFAVLDPTKILSKIKLHLLAHLHEDVLAFGPLIGVMTEAYECFNAVFRFCSILSNHRAPSRDIALQLADQEGLKHRLTGGWWPTESGEWERAGPRAREFLEARPVLQKLVGWTIQDHPTPGAVKPAVTLPKRQKGLPRPVRSAITLGSTDAKHAVNAGDYDLTSAWFPCRQVISAALDECKVGSWVFVKSPLTKDVLITGRINNILENMAAAAVIVLDHFQVSQERHEIFGMPVLMRRQSERSLMIIPTANVKFEYNAQHDCDHAKCEATGERPRMQERVDSGLVDKFIVHQPIERFVLNTHGFHNAHLLRQVLPRHLIQPIPLFADRKAKHFELAEKLREIKTLKRKRQQEKREAKKTAAAASNGANPDPAPGVESIAMDVLPPPGFIESDSDEEAPPRKKQKRRHGRRAVEDSNKSDSDYDGGIADVVGYQCYESFDKIAHC